MVEYLLARGWRRLSAHGAQCWRSPSPVDASSYTLAGAYGRARRWETAEMAEIGSLEWARNEQRELMAHYKPGIHNNVTAINDEGAEHFSVLVVPDHKYVERNLTFVHWLRDHYPDTYKELCISERPDDPDDTPG
jgi:hypothetical protein